MAYLICCKYPAHPPADGSSNAKGSADTILVSTIHFARSSSCRSPGFDVCSGWTLLFPLVCCIQWHDPRKWHNTLSHTLRWSWQSHTQHNTESQTLRGSLPSHTQRNTDSQTLREGVVAFTHIAQHVILIHENEGVELPVFSWMFRQWTVSW
jgi:hypothetical protein